MLSLFRTPTAKPEEAKGENKGEAPAADGEEAKVRTRYLRRRVPFSPRAGQRKVKK